MYSKDLMYGLNLYKRVIEHCSALSALKTYRWNALKDVKDKNICPMHERE